MNFSKTTTMQKPLALDGAVAVRRVRTRPLTFLPISFLYYAYYGFVFTLPLQVINVGISDFGVSKLSGFALIGLALTRPKLCFRRPPKVFWFFAAYLVVYIFLGLPLIIDVEQKGLASSVISQLLSQVQLLVVFWVSYNFLRSDRVKKATLLAMATSCIFIAVLVTVTGAIENQPGLGSSDSRVVTTETKEQHTRESAFGENPNITATVLALGLLALVGLAYGQRHAQRKFRLLACVTGPLLLLSVVRTGSRGNLIALILALFTLVMKPHNVRQNLKAGLVVVLSVITLVLASYHIEFIRERWERTFEEGDVAGRDEILDAAWEMFLESPIIGWLPVNHLYELGSRLGLTLRDPHNTYLWVMNETGLLGAIPFFAGLWICWRAAWRARKGSQGVIPIAILGYLLLVNFKGTGLLDKFFWVALAYVAAAGMQHVRAMAKAHKLLPKVRPQSFPG